MNNPYLEFWEKIWTDALKRQREAEDMGRWVRQTMTLCGDLTAMSRRVYGLDPADSASSSYGEMWHETAEGFQKSLTAWFSLFGGVPREEHLSLLEKYEALKRRVAAQEETIENLRSLLREKTLGAGEMMGPFQEIIQKQRDQFEQFMEGMGKLLQKKGR